MIGEDDSWQITEDWLKGLDSQEVLRYFEGRRYTTRLGDHFAACIEYVLKVSPLVSPDPLFISQQVGGWTIPNQQSSRTLKKAKGEFGSFALVKGAMMSDIIVKPIENDALIKRISNYQISRRGRVKEVLDSDIECLMDHFKKSSFDYHSATEMQGTVRSEEYHKEGFSEPIQANAVLESMSGLPELLGIAKGIQKWRVHYSVNSEQKEDLTGNKVVVNHMVPVKRTTVNGSKSEPIKRASRKTKPASHVSDKALSNVGNLSLEADGNMHSSRTFTNVTKRNPIKKSAPTRNSSCLQRAGPARRPKTQVEMEKGETAGECDFLFKANAKHLMQESSDYAWTHVHHWEVSVHFFLYVGPWEAFGLVTPGSSMWHHCGKKVLSAVEGLDPSSVELNLGVDHHLLDPSVGVDKILVLDACYISASVGDTWLDRKRSMSSKVRLCRHPNMAAKVANLFHSSLRVSKESYDCIQVQEAREYKPLRGPQGQLYDKYREDPSIIRVIPRALTKGYLFYEPKLWFSLCKQREHGGHPTSLKRTEKDDNSKRPRNLSTSYLNVNHWMGWWVYACDFAEFASSYGRKGSKWYIAPRNEWLSPIIIGGSEMHRCRRVLDIVGMLTMILKVGDEAAALDPARQRRFMVVEVCWNPDMSASHVSPAIGDHKAGMRYSKQQRVESLEEKGRWVEVSRGFIVEKTWPESREQLAHGFSLSWSPVLLGWS